MTERTVGRVLNAMGACALAGSAILSLYVAVFVARSEQALGTIVEIRRTGEGEDTLYRDVVSFMTADGQRLVVGGPGGPSPVHRVGDAIRMLYDPAHPQAARADSFNSLWGLPFGLLALGAFLMAIGFVARHRAGAVGSGAL